MNIGLPLDKIRTDGGTQPRAQIDPLVVDDYASIVAHGELPAVVVFYDGTDYWLADGFHRLEAYRRNERDEIPADVRQGTRRDAVLYSVGANADHGLRRTNADKRRAVETLLRDAEWARWSDREVARRCAVDNAFVGKVRREVSVDGQQMSRTVERGGKTYQMQTANIGQRITPEARDILKDSPLRDDPAELKRVAQLPKDQQAAVVARVDAGEAPNVKVAAIRERQDREREEARRADETERLRRAVERLARLDNEAAQLGVDLHPALAPVPPAQAPKAPVGPSATPEAPAPPPFPLGKKYSIVYADPPWHYNDRRNKHTRFCGGAAAHYRTMSTDEICALPVSQVVTSDAFLFLWATWPTLPDAMRVIEAWGFEYVTCGFNWIKTNAHGSPFFGIGYYTKSNSEVCLLATRGEPWTVSNDVSQVVMAPRREHSRKPDEVRDRIVQLLGDVPRLEMFARQAAPGWDAWGNQAPEQPLPAPAVPETCVQCRRPIEATDDRGEPNRAGPMHWSPCWSTWNAREQAAYDCDLCGKPANANTGGSGDYGSCHIECSQAAFRAGMVAARPHAYKCADCGAKPGKLCKVDSGAHDSRLAAAAAQNRAQFADLTLAAEDLGGFDIDFCCICNEDIRADDGAAVECLGERVRHAACGNVQDNRCAWCCTKVAPRDAYPVEGNLFHEACWPTAAVHAGRPIILDQMRSEVPA